jgi:hypothetical protein
LLLAFLLPPSWICLRTTGLNFARWRAPTDSIEDAAVLGPIKAKPFGWPRKSRPALTGPARDGCEI